MGLFFHRLLPFFLPSQCPGCERFLEEDDPGVCPDCLREIRWIRPPFCSVCGSPFESAEAGSHPCGDCAKEKKDVTTARALGYYEGTLQELIHRWKYRKKVYLTPIFGEWMAEGLDRYWDAARFDLLVPVPLHPRRLRQRGFNQALLLVKELHRRTGIPYRRSLLRRNRPTPPQVSLSGAEREKGVKGAFSVSRTKRLEGRTVLLVDDVYTTGATANECAKALLKGGAARVDVLTLAHAVKNR